MTSSTEIRRPVVAGQFYPADPGALSRELDLFFSNTAQTEIEGRVRALIAPHAGYMYSGRIAASAYAALKTEFRRFIIIAANHSRTNRSFKFALPAARRFATPLGLVNVSPVVDELLRSPLFARVHEAHDSHIIEVQLPFLQKRFEDFEIVPIVTGFTGTQDIKDAASLLEDMLDERTALVISSDLSHYHPYNEAVRLDEESLTAFVSMNESKTAVSEACGIPAVQILLRIAKSKSWEGALIQYANSGDVSGDRTRVVGYGAVAYYEPS